VLRNISLKMTQQNTRIRNKNANFAPKMKKMRKLAYLVAAVLGLCSFNANASVIYNDDNGKSFADTYIDSIKSLKDSIFSDTLKEDTVLPYRSKYFTLLTPNTFYHSAAKNVLGYGNSATDRMINGLLLKTYLSHPEYIRNTESRINTEGVIPEEVTESLIDKIEISTEKEAPKPLETEVAPVEVMIQKPKFWTILGDYSLQLTQNYFSDNWYKGGENFYSGMLTVTMQANYNNLDKVKWDNKLEIRFGLTSTAGDSVHDVRTSEDLVRLTSKLGFQATKNWYYTFQLIAKTQFARGYKSNDEKLYSDFMSPFELTPSLGMDYKVNWLDGKLTGTINISPLAYYFTYVDRLSLATLHGLDEGKHTKHEFGSDLTAELVWKFNDNISWKTRFYAFTSYERALIDWENTFTFQVSRFVTANIFLNPRFDDSLVRDDKFGYFQFKEYATLGLAYSF